MDAPELKTRCRELLVNGNLVKIPWSTQVRNRTMLGVNTAVGQTRSRTSTGTRFEIAAQSIGEFLESQN